MKGFRTKLREARRLCAQGKLREADQVFQEIEDGLNLDFNLQQEKKHAKRRNSNQGYDYAEPAPSRFVPPWD